MVWLLPFAETSRLWVIIIITYVVGLGRLSHVIAGSVETLFLAARAELSLGGYVARFLVPSLVGNIIGGVSLVAAIVALDAVATGDSYSIVLSTEDGAFGGDGCVPQLREDGRAIEFAGPAAIVLKRR